VLKWNFSKEKDMLKIPTIIIDWDYDDFSVLKNGNILFHTEEKLPSRIYVEGWSSPGVKIEKSLYRCVEGSVYETVDNVPF
jgi:hypothetical protein